MTCRHIRVRVLSDSAVATPETVPLLICAVPSSCDSCDLPIPDRLLRELPPNEEVSLVQPLAPAPLRHTAEPDISAEALPRALVIVDVMQVGGPGRHPDNLQGA